MSVVYVNLISISSYHYNLCFCCYRYQFFFKLNSSLSVQHLNFLFLMQVNAVIISLPDYLLDTKWLVPSSSVFIRLQENLLVVGLFLLSMQSF